PGFLVVTRGRCAPSILPLTSLPGYTLRARPVPVIRIRVPTCEASDADMIDIAEGMFIHGGAGDPPSMDAAADPDAAEQRLFLATFQIDRTEITNAAFEVFAEHAPITQIA